MKIEQRIEMKYHYSYCSYNGIEIEDNNGNKVLVQMTNDQWISLAEMLDAKREHINEKRKEELEELNVEADS